MLKLKILNVCRLKTYLAVRPKRINKMWHVLFCDLTSCLKKHNKNVYKSYFYAFLKTWTWILGHYSLGSSLMPYGQLWSGYMQMAFNFGVAVSWSWKYINIDSTNAEGTSFSCHVLHILIFYPYPARNNAKRQRGEDIMRQWRASRERYIVVTQTQNKNMM